MRNIWLLMLLPGMLLQCAIPDSDRCGNGLEFDKKAKFCRRIDTETSAEVDTERDGGKSDDSEGLDDAGTVIGAIFGTPCHSDTDCDGQEVDFCLLNPMAPNDPGACTIENCTSGDCPDAFQCCDCASLGGAVACMPDEGAATAAKFGCSCE